MRTPVVDAALAEVAHKRSCLCSQCRIAINNSIAKPTPPTFVLKPSARPKRSPQTMPSRWQTASKAVP